MPDRKFSSTSEYRYGFNGQESSGEVSANTTTALYWEYDGRIGRRWNIDPRPNVSISGYSCFESNPIRYSDTYGDSLSLPPLAENTYSSSLNDLLSIINMKSNLNFIKVGKNGHVSLAGDKLDILRAANIDKGFGLIYDLINTDKLFFYSASEVVSYRERDIVTGKEGPTLRGDLKEEYKEGDIISHEATKISLKNSVGQSVELSHINKVISNLATNPLGEEIENTFEVPARLFYYSENFQTKRFDGQVSIAEGEFYNMAGDQKIIVSRASIIYHELRENYFRVVAGWRYQLAHPWSIYMESSKFGGSYGNPNPGVTPQFFFFKKGAK